MRGKDWLGWAECRGERQEAYQGGSENMLGQKYPI